VGVEEGFHTLGQEDTHLVGWEGVDLAQRMVPVAAVSLVHPAGWMDSAKRRAGYQALDPIP